MFWDGTYVCLVYGIIDGRMKLLVYCKIKML